MGCGKLDNEVGSAEMKLYIDTSNSEKIIVGFNGEKIESDARKERVQKLLAVVSDQLKKRGKGVRDIKEVEVNSGPGSFTGLRVGISVANALGWSLGIPVNGKDIKVQGPVEPKYK